MLISCKLLHNVIARRKHHVIRFQSIVCISIRVNAKRGRNDRNDMGDEGLKTTGTVKYCLGLLDQQARRDCERPLATNACGVRQWVLACTHSK